MKYYVKLIYFRKHGKYYTEGGYVSDYGNLWEIWEEVDKMNKEGKLPGLIEGSRFPIIWVKVPQHPFNHPHLVVDLSME